MRLNNFKYATEATIRRSYQQCDDIGVDLIYRAGNSLNSIMGITGFGKPKLKRYLTTKGIYIRNNGEQLTGRKISPEVRKRMGDSRRGLKRKREDEYISPANERARKTIEYVEWRVSVFKRDNYTCQSCSKEGGELRAHHIKPFSLCQEHRYDINNGLTLCIPCHKNAHPNGYASHIREIV